MYVLFLAFVGSVCASGFALMAIEAWRRRRAPKPQSARGRVLVVVRGCTCPDCLHAAMLAAQAHVAAREAARIDVTWPETSKRWSA